MTRGHLFLAAAPLPPSSSVIRRLIVVVSCRNHFQKRNKTDRNVHRADSLLGCLAKYVQVSKALSHFYVNKNGFLTLTPS